MTPTQVLQEIRKMRFEEAYEGWSEGRLTQADAARSSGLFALYIEAPTELMMTALRVNGTYLSAIALKLRA